MSDVDAVLFANEAFYQALSAGDFDRLEELWSRSAPLACTHPGWNALLGREAVMESWRAIIDNGAPAIECVAPRVHLLGGTALVTCYERVAGGYLVASNIFVREAKAWKMVHHHAGPAAAPPAAEEAAKSGPQTLH